MKIGVYAQPSQPGELDWIREVERLGADSVWVPEYWGHDAMTPLGAVAAVTDRIRLGTAIVQLGARTPALLGMSAMALQELSDGRFVLGVGTSGPQVMEGWHGVRFDRPVRRTRETIEIIRTMCAGERLRHDGELYQLPLPESEGRAIRSAARTPVHVPIHVASLGPANLRLTGELADGWIGNSFFVDHARAAFFDDIATGASRTDRTLADVELTVNVGLEFTRDDPAEIEAAWARHAAGFAFTFGAMGSEGANFYNNAFARQGLGEAVAEVARLWRDGDRAAAAEAVPAAIGREQNLIGPDHEITRRLAQYRDAGVTMLRIGVPGDDLDTRADNLGRLLDLTRSL